MLFILVNLMIIDELKQLRRWSVAEHEQYKAGALKCVLTALHVNCMILFDKVLQLEQGQNVQVLQNVKVYFK